MHAAVFYGPNNIAVRDDVPFSNNGIKVKVRACAVCGYDARVFRNGHGKVTPPIVLGHEICGETLESFTAADGAEIKAGSRVAIAPIIPCLRCRYCDDGQYNLCLNLKEIGSSVNGGFAEYVKIPEETLQIGGLVPVPDNLGDGEAALLEPLACCLNSFSQVGPVKKESTIAIIGDGPIGLIHLQLSKLYGARTVVIGKIPSRLSKAKLMGADRVLFNDAEARDVLAGETISAVIVATSDPSAIDFAIRIAGRNSTINLFAGVPKGTSVTVDANWLHYNQISIAGSFSSTPSMLHEAARLAANQKIDLSGIVSHRFPLDRIEKAIDVTEKYLGLRAVINNF